MPLPWGATYVPDNDSLEQEPSMTWNWMAWVTRLKQIGPQTARYNFMLSHGIFNTVQFHEYLWNVNRAGNSARHYGNTHVWQSVPDPRCQFSIPPPTCHRNLQFLSHGPLWPLLTGLPVSCVSSATIHTNKLWSHNSSLKTVPVAYTLSANVLPMLTHRLVQIHLSRLSSNDPALLSVSLVGLLQVPQTCGLHHLPIFLLSRVCRKVQHAFPLHLRPGRPASGLRGLSPVPLLPWSAVWCWPPLTGRPRSPLSSVALGLSCSHAWVFFQVLGLALLLSSPTA